MKRLALRSGIHLLLAAVWFAGAAAAITWPQSRAAADLDRQLAAQRQQIERLLGDQDALRAEQLELAAWSEKHQVLTVANLEAHLLQIHTTVTETGAELLELEVAADPGHRWAALVQLAAAGAPEEALFPVRPKQVSITLRGSFPQLYEALTALSGPRPLAVLEQWEMRATGRQLQAQVVSTLFAIDTGITGSPAVTRAAPPEADEPEDPTSESGGM